MRQTPRLGTPGARFIRCAVLLLLILTTPALARAQCDKGFALEAEYFVFETDGRPIAVAAGDWDEDGRIDLAALNPSAGTIALLFGEVGFRMRRGGNVPVGGASSWMVSHDMNGDGHVDLVVTGALGTRVFAGDGDGGFQPSAFAPVSGVQLAIGDLDRDGATDVVVVGDRIVALLARASGFEERLLHGEVARSVAAGDLDGDGDLDLVAATDPALLVLLNDGAVGFTARAVLRPEHDGSQLMTSVAVGDLNGDRVLDLVAVKPRGDGDGLTLFGNGDGTFRFPWAFESDEKAASPPASPGSPVARPEGSGHRERLFPSSTRHIRKHPHFVTLADLDGDGRMNPIVLCNEPGDEVMDRRSISGPNCAIATDIDGDGRLDVVVSSPTSGEIAIHPGLGDGTLRVNPKMSLSVDEPRQGRLTDLNRDGIEDFVVVVQYGDMFVAVGLPAGGFGLFEGVRGHHHAFAFDFADFDEDGVLDLISEDEGVHLHLGNGDGTFEDGRSVSPATARGIAAGDLNGDGHQDLVISPVQPGEPGCALLGLGDGSFSTGPPTGVGPGVLALRELSGDGILDLVVGGGAGGEVAFGVGDGSFVHATPLSELRSWGMAFGDVDGDGAIDIAGPGVIYLNRAGRFERRASPSQGPPVLGDMNGDGLADLVVGTGSLVVWISNGDGTFGPGIRFGPDGIPVLGHCDRNGSLDLITLRSDDEDRWRNSATLMFNRTRQNHPPVVTEARTDIAELWPPIRDLAPVRIVGVTDPDGDDISIEVLSITQDEPVLESRGTGTCPDAIVAGESIQLRRERSAGGNGRVYVVRFRATDDCGASEEGEVSVRVPHDQGGGACADDGQDYSSLDACGAHHASLAVGPTDAFRMTRRANGAIELSYSLAAGSDVRLDLFDLAGRRVATLDTGFREAGEYRHVWDPSSRANGLYYARLVTGALVRTRTVLLVR